MDEMKLKLSTKIMKGLVNKIIETIIQKKLDYNVKFNLNDLEVTVVDGKAHLHTDVDLEMDYDELIKILKSIV
jgi:hypothetical protein